MQFVSGPLNANLFFSLTMAKMAMWRDYILCAEFSCDQFCHWQTKMYH